MRSARRHRIQGERRLFIQLSSDATELTLDFRPGKPAAIEALAQGITVERDAAGKVLRMRVSGLRRKWLTNAYIYQSVA